MKQLIIAAILILTVSVQSQWFSRPSGVTSDLRAVKFWNLNTGWAAGDGGVILKTTNGGTNWSLINTGITNNLYALTCRDSVTLVTCGSEGKIMISSNAGLNWISVSSGVNSTLRSLTVEPGISAKVYAAGDNGVILFSSNNGSTWSIEASNTNLQLNCIIYFTGGSTGYIQEVMGNNGLKKYHFTSNAWQPDAGFPASSENLLAGISSSRLFYPLAFMCTGSGKIYKRRFGTSKPWFLVNSGTTSALNSMSDGNVSMYGYGNYGKYVWAAGENGTIIYSADTGNTWQAQNSGITTALNSIAMLDSIKGCAVGNGGVILQTITGGTIGIQQISSNVPENFLLKQNYPNPFNPVTNIEFSLSAGSIAVLSVFDVAGRLVKTLLNSEINAGVYKADFDASGLSSGIYYYKLTAGSFSETKKMILIK